MSRTVGFVALCAGLVVLCAGCKKGTLAARNKRDFLKLTARLKKSLLPKLPTVDSLEASDCPDGWSAPKRPIGFLHEDVLRELVSITDPASRPTRFPPSKLTDRAFRRLLTRSSAEPDRYRKAVRASLGHRYLGVFFTEELDKGQVENQIIVRKPHFSGWLVVFDLETGSQLTALQVEASGGKHITQFTRSRGRLADDSWDSALLWSLTGNVWKAANEALSKSCAGLQLMKYY